MIVQNSGQSGRPSLENSQSAVKWSATLALKKKFVGKDKVCERSLDLDLTYKMETLAWKYLDIKKTNYGSTTLEVFLFNHRQKLSLLWQVHRSSVPSINYSAVEIRNITHFPRDTFPRRAHFVIMDSLRNRKTRFIRKLEHWCWKGSICINFCTSRLSLQKYLGSYQCRGWLMAR